MSSRSRAVVLLVSVAATGLLFLLNSTKWHYLQVSSLCTCDRCLSKDASLLSRHLNPSVEPILSAKTNLSEEAFRWWKGIQNERRDFRFFNETVNKLFEIFPPSPKLRKPDPDKCRTCAVVGNSVNLKRSHYGPLIDYQDVVIRMNSAKTKGFEQDVGTKTTHHVMYPESAVDLHNSTHLVLFPFKIMDLEWLIKAFTTGFYGIFVLAPVGSHCRALVYTVQRNKPDDFKTRFVIERQQNSNPWSYAPIKTKINANKDLVMVINPAFMKYSHEIWLQKKGAYPSTGFMTFIFALHICDEVHVFGFGADSDGNWSHYFEVLRNKNLKTGQHPGNHEYNIIQQLANEKIVRFYKGS